VFENGTLRHHGRYRQVDGGHGERLATFREWLRSRIHEYKPTHVVYEKPFAGRRRNAFGVLTMYVAAVLLAHWEMFAIEMPEAHAVPAREVKRRNKMRKGQDHEANKKIAVLLANRLYGLRLKFKPNDKTKKVSQDDEADAILLGRAWLITERPGLVGERE
jgi:Holliday junction resolvasome RuvABC endonuclease subunit